MTSKFWENKFWQEGEKMNDDQVSNAKRGRGRPLGAVKSNADRVRDRVRTMATLYELFVRTSRANNVNQFASWFDGAMRQLRPGRAWETAANNKWRKNFSGDVALTTDSVNWLGELFPDAASLFDCGPGNLWQALWRSASSPDDLWSIYDAADAPWGRECYGDALEALQIKVYCSYDFNESLDEEDLGRAVVLKRLNEQFGMGTPEDGIDLYLCIKAAFVCLGTRWGGAGVFYEIADHLADRERCKVETDWVYRKTVKQHWAGGRGFGERGLLEYLDNPFLRMAECAPSPHQADRWWSLAALTYDNYRRSESAARKSIRTY